MNTFRGNLTRLTKQIKEKLPDESDIYGYPGVSKSLLVSAVETAYGLSYGIEEIDDEPRFEIIALKRFGSSVNLLLKEILDSENPKERFDEFLDRLSTLVEKVKLTYFIVAKDGLRDDEELAEIKHTIVAVKEECKELTDAKASLEENVNKVGLDLSSISVMREQADTDYMAISKWRNESEKYYTEMSETHESIEGWDKEIEACRDEILAKKAIFDDMSKRVVDLEGRMSSNVIQGEASKNELPELETEIRTLNAQAREALGDASRVGMAASFKQRKDELRRDLMIWQGLFVAGIAGIVLVAIVVLLPELKKADISWSTLVTKVALISPFVWLGWFAARQYSYVCRIREDYAFKHASAMAYEGHKKAAREASPDLEEQLLAFSMENMVQNPIRLYYMKPDHATPIQETFDRILDRFRIRKTRVSPAGNVEVEMEQGK